MKTLRTAFCALFLFGLMAAPPAQAQTPWQLGPLLGVNVDNNELVVGATARINLKSAPITLNPGFDLYPGIDGSLFVVNFDGHYHFEGQAVVPYAGGGISWSRRTPEGGESRSDIGLNLKGGVLFNARGLGQPYAGAVLNIADAANPFILEAGFLFRIGG